MPVKTSLSYGLRGKNLAAQKTASTHAGRLITDITASVRRTINNLVTRSVREGVSPRDLADQIRQVIGLSERQEAAVATYRKNLVGSGLSRQRVNMLVERYVAKSRRSRAVTIARFEVMNSLNTAKLDDWLTAQKNGDIPKGAKKGVIVTPDEKLCEVCASTEGKRYALNADIVKGRKTPPFHPRCRCAPKLLV